MKQPKKQSAMRTLRVFAAMSFSTLTLAFSACAPGGSGGPPVANLPENSNGAVLQGTVSGGGGNGCDGKAFEVYAKKITDLNEYKLFIRPLLRRMSEESADPIVTYMLWAAEEKAWFFAPCELEKLSSAQIGVAGDSDQLARHTKNGIQIYAIEDAKNLKQAKTYYQKKSKAKAALLLHEMVMGARLLMKRSAKEQCTVLAKKDAKMCSDPELMAIAESRSVDPSQVDVMDAADHEAVRTMTSLIAQKDADLSTANLKALRDRLGFHFPWDRAVSSLTHDGLRDAFARSQQLGDRFRVKEAAAEHPYFRGEPMTCAIVLETKNQLMIQANFVTSVKGGGTNEEVAALLARMNSNYVGKVCEENADRIHQLYEWNEGTNTFDSRQCSSDATRVSFLDYQAHFWVGRNKFSARGVIRNGVLYDEVALTNVDAWPWLKLGKSRSFSAGVIRILVTRDEAPRIRSISFEPKQVLDRKTGKQESDRPVELLPVPDSPIVECSNESLSAQ